MTPVTASAFFVEPFPHVTSPQALPTDLVDRALAWMETTAPWTLRIASFYEQWEMHLDRDTLPADLRQLVGSDVVSTLLRDLLPDDGGAPALVEVTAHRMLPGQTIRVHNDYRAGGETHRVLVQLNRGWRDSYGGLLMLFGSEDADDVRRVLRPVHGSGFGFRISERSFHAVSTVRVGERFTLVYSFRREATH